MEAGPLIPEKAMEEAPLAARSAGADSFSVRERL